jgi:hypothetical protein
MLSNSVRSAVSTATLAAHSISCQAPRVAAASASFAICRRSLHQRRFSSSKTSSPKNRQHGPKALPAREVSAAGSESKATSSEAKSSGGTSEKRKRRANKAGEEARSNEDPFLALPSVPNTQHLSQEGMVKTLPPNSYARTRLTPVGSPWPDQLFLDAPPDIDHA